MEMARHLFIVSRHHRDLHDYLVTRFEGDAKVEVILDRRRGERRRRGRNGSAADRRRHDRRVHRDVDAELRERSHVILTIEDEPALRLA